MLVWWSIREVVQIEVLKPVQTVNAELYYEQQSRVNQSLIEKCPTIINRRAVSLQRDNARPHSVRLTQQKINESRWGVNYYHIHHTHPILRHRISIYSDLQYFPSGEKIEKFK